MLQLPPPVDDGLLIPEVGDWSRDKHHFLRRYIDAFTQSMRSHWSQLHYVDLFAGAGLGRIRGTNQLDWGSPVIAAHARPSFDGLHFCELRRDRYQALSARMRRLRVKVPIQLVHGDANEKTHAIADKIPANSLSLAFLDPHGLHLHFDTLTVLAFRRVDLIIFFPDRLDALRNWAGIYIDDPESNLDAVLGPGSNWRPVLEKVTENRRAEALQKLYVSQIGKLGFRHFDYERIHSEGRPLYLLIYCSKHELGADIWRRVSLQKPDRQRTFDFGPDE
jgi:three-Cys-motif partner protein